MLLQEPSWGGSAETREYSIPAWYEDGRTIIDIPVEFFTGGWVYLLSDSEVRMYLILSHLAKRFPSEHRERGVYLNERDRKWTYSVSRDVYESHILLERFGLISRIDDPRRHGDGKAVNFSSVIQNGGILSPHRFKVVPPPEMPLDAISKARMALLNYPPSKAQMTRDS
jgi:hypothetical protein